MDDEEETLIDEIDTLKLLKNLKIFDRNHPQEPIPNGFTAATVVVDAKPASSLCWKSEISAAQELIKNGYKICFELDLGLFGSEFKGIANQGQFQTLVLALDEFRNRLLKPFQEHIEAVILYRSPTAFSSIEERDIQMDYLDLLRQELPDELITLLLFDCQNIQDPYSFVRMFSPDRFNLFTLGLAHAPVLLSNVCWNAGGALLGYIGRDISKYHPQECSKALLMPRFTSDAASIRPLIESLILQNKRFKIISEDFLALEWDGLDELYIQKTTLAATSLRMVDGFIAAGGVVIDQNPPQSI